MHKNINRTFHVGVIRKHAFTKFSLLILWTLVKNTCFDYTQVKQWLEESSYGQTSWRFSALVLLTFFGQIILCYGDCPMHYRMFGNTFGLFILYIQVAPSHTPPSLHMTTRKKKSPDIAKCPLWRTYNYPRLRTTLLSNDQTYRIFRKRVGSVCNHI